MISRLIVGARARTQRWARVSVLKGEDCVPALPASSLVIDRAVLLAETEENASLRAELKQLRSGLTAAAEREEQLQAQIEHLQRQLHLWLHPQILRPQHLWLRLQQCLRLCLQFLRVQLLQLHLQHLRQRPRLEAGEVRAMRFLLRPLVLAG